MTAIVDQLMQGGGKSSANKKYVECAANRIGCEVELLLAILEVESGGDAFDAQGRLINLPEKHIFRRMLQKSMRAKALRMGLAARKWTRGELQGPRPEGLRRPLGSD